MFNLSVPILFYILIIYIKLQSFLVCLLEFLIISKNLKILTDLPEILIGELERTIREYILSLVVNF